MIECSSTFWNRKKLYFIQKFLHSSWFGKISFRFLHCDYWTLQWNLGPPHEFIFNHFIINICWIHWFFFNMESKESELVAVLQSTDEMDPIVLGAFQNQIPCDMVNSLPNQIWIWQTSVMYRCHHQTLQMNTLSYVEIMGELWTTIFTLKIFPWNIQVKCGAKGGEFWVKKLELEFWLYYFICDFGQFT